MNTLKQNEIIPSLAEQQAAGWAFIRRERNRRIELVRFEYERNEREKRLKIAPKRDDSWMLKLDDYVQALADIPSGASSPFEVVWPVQPS